jgi:hypothetical protein
MITELTGYFSPDDDSDMNERLGEVKKEINREGILSGGHKKCAANASLPDLIRMLAEKPEAFLPYAKDQLSDRYEEGLAHEVVGYARAVVASGRYATWTEAVLADVLGEEAEEAIEELDNVPHEGLTVVRVEEPETTIDQTKLYEESELGDGSFNVDDWYADRIETALTKKRTDAARAKLLAEHARELIIAAVADVVPNKELYQLSISAI